MAVYTHTTPTRFIHGSTNRAQSVKGARATTFSRYLKGVRTRSRGTSLYPVAKRIYSEEFPKFGGSLGTSFANSGGNADLDLLKKNVKVVGKSSNTFRSHA
jgi:hypothetical protein